MGQDSAWGIRGALNRAMLRSVEQLVGAVQEGVTVWRRFVEGRPRRKGSRVLRMRPIWGNLPLLLWKEMPQNILSTLKHASENDRGIAISSFLRKHCHGLLTWLKGYQRVQRPLLVLMCRVTVYLPNSSPQGRETRGREGLWGARKGSCEQREDGVSATGRDP